MSAPLYAPGPYNKGRKSGRVAKTPAPGATPPRDPETESPAPGRSVPVGVTITLPGRLTREEDGSYSAEVPALPGCFSCGATLEEALANLREAAEGWLLASQDLQTGAFRFPEAAR
jgi:predicted RNase H-like HicB family nuclease